LATNWNQICKATKQFNARCTRDTFVIHSPYWMPRPHNCNCGRYRQPIAIQWLLFSYNLLSECGLKYDALALVYGLTINSAQRTDIKAYT